MKSKTYKVPSIYILILNYNSWQDTIECIESVLASDYENYQIIVIDNYSPNDSQEKIIEYLEGERKPHIENIYFKNKIKKREDTLPYVYYEKENDRIVRDLKKEDLVIIDRKLTISYPIIFMQTGENLGFAGGNNVALRMLISDNRNKEAKVLLLNPDTFISENALSELNKIENPHFISSCLIKNYNTPLEPGYLGAYKFIKIIGISKAILENESQKIDFTYGGALFTNIATFNKIGFLPEDYFLYWEETDWCFNAKKVGIESIICSRAIVFDKVGTSIGRGYLAHYYFIRNGLFFYKKYLKLFLVGLFFFNIIRYLNKLRKGEWASARGIVSGTLDFFRGIKGFVPSN